MSDELAQLDEILAWVGDEPFRLFAAVCLIIALVTFFFFRNEHPAYKAFAVLLLFLGAGGIGYSSLPQDRSEVEESDFNAGTSDGFESIQETISASIENVRHTALCVEAYATKVAAIASSFPNEKQVSFANDIVQMELSIKHYLDTEFPGAFQPCGNSSIPGRGFIPSCQAGADAFVQIKQDILSGDLTDAKINADTAKSVLRTCKPS